MLVSAQFAASMLPLVGLIFMAAVTVGFNPLKNVASGAGNAVCKMLS